MSYAYGRRSLNKLETCHEGLITIAPIVLSRSPYDITIVHGWRGEDIQNALQESGASTKRYPHSKHNFTDHDGAPMSLALDFAPWVGGTIPWGETHIFACIAGMFICVGREFGYTVRWGGDWDSDGLTTDQKLMDWGHIELVL